MTAIRRGVDPKKPKRGKQVRLFEGAGYSSQVIVTNSNAAAEEVSRFYNRPARSRRTRSSGRCVPGTTP